MASSANPSARSNILFPVQGVAETIARTVCARLICQGQSDPEISDTLKPCPSRSAITSRRSPFFDGRRVGAVKTSGWDGAADWRRPLMEASSRRQRPIHAESIRRAYALRHGACGLVERAADTLQRAGWCGYCAPRRRPQSSAAVVAMPSPYGAVEGNCPRNVLFCSVVLRA
jgi:hypothetical protein